MPQRICGVRYRHGRNGDGSWNGLGERRPGQIREEGRILQFDLLNSWLRVSPKPGNQERDLASCSVFLLLHPLAFCSDEFVLQASGLYFEAGSLPLEAERV